MKTDLNEHSWNVSNLANIIQEERITREETLVPEIMIFNTSEGLHHPSNLQQVSETQILLLDLIKAMPTTVCQNDYVFSVVYEHQNVW